MALATLFGLAYGSTSIAASGTGVDPTAAAQACAAGRPVTATLGAGDVRYLRRLAACVLREERSQLGLRYTQDHQLSRGVRAALNEFVTLAYWKNRDLKAAARTEKLVADTLAAAVCHANRGFQAQSGWADTSPPALTPRGIAIELATMLRSPKVPMRSPRAVFGVASRRGLLFEKNDPNGADLGIVVVTCPSGSIPAGG